MVKPTTANTDKLTSNCRREDRWFLL